MTKLRTVKDHTPGHIRYFTYWLDWPDGSEQWVDQTPFVHPLQFELSNTRFMKDPLLPKHVGADIARTGEASWIDSNSVRHTVKVESMKRKRNWGVKR